MNIETIKQYLQPYLGKKEYGNLAVIPSSKSEEICLLRFKKGLLSKAFATISSTNEHHTIRYKDKSQTFQTETGLKSGLVGFINNIPNLRKQ